MRILHVLTFLWGHCFSNPTPQNGKLLSFFFVSKLPPISIKKASPSPVLTAPPNSMLPWNTHNQWVSLAGPGALGEKAIMLHHSHYHLSSSCLHKPVTSEIKTFTCTWVELVGWKRTWRRKWLKKQSQQQASRMCLFGFPFNFAISSSQPLLPHQTKKFQPAK